ncbi:hypothetical protein AX769_04995 [Frondihabitans sp. PAMC 28766]|uniref:right-handed parallel beta-helix repeat-containing protein n=1 Tax=Frondihabitans sp. PAMC 28766 TaxID=1795630 RepID=UPI00078DA3D9|nr:CBM35 domain-containing protein [Frondihabitans sp. PAMC 28766]AMM19613.1 hypothetical protein AX769_04995 [Frondihabitans sp. PAMC 28766]
MKPHASPLGIRAGAVIAAILAVGSASMPLMSGAAASAATTTTKYEAESAKLTGGAVVETDHTGYSGSGFVGGYTDSDKGTASTAFTVSAATAGTYALALEYSDGTGSSRTLTLGVDGKTQQITLPATTDWNTWAAETTSVTLAAGSHTIAYSYGTADNGNANLDYLAVTETSTSGGGGTTPPATTAGAQLPYTEYVAAQQPTTGTVLPVSRTYPSLASEATTRSAVQLTGTGQYVSVTLAHPANSIVVRYSIPDKSDGSTATAPLAVYAGSSHVADLSLTTKYSWLYGGGYTDTHSPSNGAAHHFFDETRALIGEQPAGTVIKLQKDAADTAASYTIDLVDTEEVAAAPAMPSGYTSITSFGVTPNSGADDTSAINSALSSLSGTGTGLWFPAGTYDISDRIGFTNVSIQGAGEWRTTIQSTAENGNGGLYSNGGENHVSNLSIFGDQTSRNNNAGAAGIEGEFTSGSTITNVWIEHTKVGIWTDGPTTGLTVSGARVRDVYADGIHLNGGTSNTTVEQSEVRNAGDDGLAMDTEGGDVTGSTFTADTVSNIIQANGIGVYGGGNNTVSDSLVTDTVAFGAGITISSRFGQAFDGPTTVSGNTLQRTGSYSSDLGIDLGALWIYADQTSITQPIAVTGNTISGSTYQGVLVKGPQAVSALTMSGDTIAGAGTSGLDIEGASGALNVSSTTVSGAATGLVNNGNGFTVTRGSGNSGF